MKKREKIVLWVIGIIVALIVIYIVVIPLVFCTRIESVINNPKYSFCSKDSDCFSSECGCLNKNWFIKSITSLCGHYMGCKVPTSCTCESNQCQSHYGYETGPEIESEGVILVTDKTEYEKGEEVRVTIKNNNLDGQIKFWVIGIGKELSMEGVNLWEDVRFDIDCPCMAKCDKAPKILNPKEEIEFIWDQKSDDCKQADSGKYRARVDWLDPKKEYMMGENPVSISNEFIIKTNDAISDSDLIKIGRDGTLHYTNDTIRTTVTNNYDRPIYLVGYLSLFSFDHIDKWEETSCNFVQDEIIKINPGETKEFDFPTDNCSFGEDRYEFKIGMQYNFAIEQSVVFDAYSDLFFIKDTYVYSDDIGWDWDNDFPCHNLTNIEECDRIDWPIIDSAHSCHSASKNMCYSCFARMTKNPNVCEKFSNTDLKEYCYVGVAAELAKAGRKNEINFCNKIREITQYNMRQECLNYAK